MQSIKEQDISGKRRKKEIDSNLYLVAFITPHSMRLIPFVYLSPVCFFSLTFATPSKWEKIESGVTRKLKRCYEARCEHLYGVKSIYKCIFLDRVLPTALLFWSWAASLPFNFFCLSYVLSWCFSHWKFYYCKLPCFLPRSLVLFPSYKFHFQVDVFLMLVCSPVLVGFTARRYVQSEDAWTSIISNWV